MAKRVLERIDGLTAKKAAGRGRTVRQAVRPSAALDPAEAQDGYDTDQALRESETRARALIEASPDILMRVTREGMHIEVHVPERVAALFPRGQERLVGKNVADIFEPELAREHERCRCTAIDTGKMQRWQYSVHLDGRMRHLEARFVRSGDDEVVIAVSDVTERVDFEREAVNSIERERSRIGRDLHDGLGQLLTGVKLILEPVKKHVNAAGSAKIEQALELINLAIAQTSELARGLSPVSKDGGFTFANALEQLAKQAGKFFHIKCSVTHRDLPDDLDEELAINLYRIAQEALTNSVKHGRSTEVQIHCRAETDLLVLVIEDDGAGIPEDCIRGMGMHSMHCRARAIGGELLVGPGARGGTVVRCVCPLSERAEANRRRSRAC
ncbi:MAG TPA: ATP-binding protein [Gammaproteobacteria bacterium]|nr:ATP-binding protein [Gammaproteobacteria bacterium]